jgi:hypothetical protein
MKVNLIIEQKNIYLQQLKLGQVQPDSLFRRCVKNWQKNFDLEEMRLGPILDRALKNEISGRLWGGENHSIKSGLIMLANSNPDLFWTAIKDLFNENKELNLRSNRFLHHCDIMLDEIATPANRINTHHQDYYSVSLLLSLQYPDQYCLFNYKAFEKFAHKIGVMNLPVDTDLERYYKIMKAVTTIFSKDEKLMNSYYERLEEDVYMGPTPDLAYDIMQGNMH